MKTFSPVEQVFYDRFTQPGGTTRIPYLLVENFPQLGFLAALRFLEWVGENPEETISLPAGKTPEYFIKWVPYLLKRWDQIDLVALREEYGLTLPGKPDLRGLYFVQMDEFYPIDPRQRNSFHHFVQRYYVQGFGLDPARALLINCESIPRPVGHSLESLFPSNQVDISLRYRESHTKQEKLQREAIFLVDQWCSEYEQRIRDQGGLGFFLGGIGPDGHIAFNIRGSDLNSTTRLTETNFETQATAAADLGGIEISSQRLVITIGPATITYNSRATAIIIAAGEAKAPVVKNALEHPVDIHYPATVLQRLEDSRFYLTRGAASRLQDRVVHYFESERWTTEKTQRAVIDRCQEEHRFGHQLTPEELQKDPRGILIPGLGPDTVPEVLEALKAKIELGITLEENQGFLHTGPHHDDIMLGFLPHIVHLVRSPLNRHHFAIFTSGFTSVTNHYLVQVLENTAAFLREGRIEMTTYPDFFQRGYRLKRNKDVFHYLDRLAGGNREGQSRGLSHRVVRALVEIYAIKTVAELGDRIERIISYLRNCYDGERNTPPVQRLKGMIREFEEELVWAHYGIQVEDIHHLRLGFYSGDIFTETPRHRRDVQPILDLLRKLKPSVISLALDPEGSGPDTHYKSLQALAEAVRAWSREVDLSALRLWGYRNVWYRFHPEEADIIVPVSLNSLAILQHTFMNCYLSQKEASFPSHEWNGPFCDLMGQIWVEQLQLLELVLGRDYWYQNPHPRLRAAHGALFLKEMDLDQFLAEARRLEQSMEGQISAGS